MTRLLTLGPLAVAAVCVGAVAPASAQWSRPAVPPAAHPAMQRGAPMAASSPTELRGVVVDDRGRPLVGAVVSALGSHTAFAVSDREGRFAFRTLTPGPYLIRAHLQGYVPARARIVQVTATGRNTSTIALTRRDQGDEPQVLAAGVGVPDAAPPGHAEDEPDAHDHSETAWRLRHLKRSVLKDAAAGVLDVHDASIVGDSLAGLGRAVGVPARLATSLLADIPPIAGQINLLTSTAFDRPQDLFTADGLMPRGVAYIALTTDGSGGQWAMRGATTQGDLASWIVDGSFVRSAGAPHRYEAGFSYGMQRYLGGNADALAAMADGSRNVGSMFAYDTWTVSPQVALNYGVKYARYDYLADRALLSPRASLSLKPLAGDSLALRVTMARREAAPGAEEFLPPATGIWLPPERTFSPLSSRSGFTAERTDHVEFAAERLWFDDVLVGVRAFRQQVDDQLVTLFGVALPGKAPANVGHYYVASGGDVEARGWGVSVSRDVFDRVRAAVDYTQADADWVRAAPDARTLALVAASALRTEAERLHALNASLEAVVPATATRVLLVYKVNSGIATANGDAPGGAGTRFAVQVNQALPFMGFTNAHWEMLLAVRNTFRDDLLDASIYDELLVVHPPKRVVGGVAVKF